ncbi:PAS domain-containing protein [Mesobacillus boroniphilus]|uniref:histidine kinase n=1 Tax=Mesobacillus boroniphilus TaxID=308892 RepID=A0A944GVH9_9BACI|nr:histidine kinase [Mesobacillus boroniphilus]MBS8263557.1 PAS domain-containing protein [Mesobacillus boroniphilus]
MVVRTEFLAEIVDHLPEGMIVMDKNRMIHYLNEKAVDMTGWKLGEKVPYCTYCQERELDEDENRCILTSDEPIPSFNSHLAVYEGLEEFEMSLKKMTILEEVYYVLRIRPPVQNENSERARFHELLVQETLLAQEAERKRIAMELHDHIGQSVYSIFLGLEVIKQNISEDKYQNHVTNMVNVMEKTLEDIKRLTKSLRPEIVYDIGLEKSLRQAVKDWRKLYQIDIFLEMELDMEQKLDPEKELHLFRIIQESITNSVRHGKATYFSIHLKTYYQYIFFQLYDNGNGFISSGCKTKGLGLKHMYERCKMLDGDIKWISKEGGPTRVEGFVSLTNAERVRKDEPNDHR